MHSKQTRTNFSFQLVNMENQDVDREEYMDLF